MYIYIYIYIYINVFLKKHGGNEKSSLETKS